MAHSLRYHRIGVLAASLLSFGTASLLAACGGENPKPAPLTSTESQPGPTVTDVRIVRNGVIAPRLAVRFEEFDAPALAQLRDQEQLDTVIAGKEGDFQKMLALKEWVAAQFPEGSPVPYPPWNSIDILDWIRRGVTGGFCGQYSQVLLQSMASLGMTARYVELGSAKIPNEHFIVEAWSNEFGKWIALDADYNLYFERGGIPMSALEVHEALVTSRLGDVSVVKGAFRDGHPDPGTWPKGTAEVYYYVRYHLKANHLSAPEEPAFDRFNDMIEWADERTVPWEASLRSPDIPKLRLTSQIIDDRNQVESPLNQVVARVVAQTEHEVVLGFENNVHGFASYEVRLSNPRTGAGPWEKLESATYLWQPRALTHVLEVRGVNDRGIAGVATMLVAELTPPQRH